MKRQARLNSIVGGGAGILLLLVILLGLSPLTPDPLAIDIPSRLQGPSAAHWLGTDEFGRDVLARVALGAVISGGIATAVVALATLVGTAAGMAAGYFRGWTDRIVMAVAEALLAFPGILLALALVAVLGVSRWGIVGALTLAYVPIVVRVVRGSTLSVRELDYIAAARIAGAGHRHILRQHVLPNMVAPILVLMTSLFGWVILSESALSFLGVGVSPPTPTWGNMLSAARPHLASASHLAIAPGLCITLALIAINLLGDALRDHFDPRTRR